MVDSESHMTCSDSRNRDERREMNHRLDLKTL